MKTSQVYFVECAGRIKIGYSADVKRRMHDLATAAPQRLTLIAAIDGAAQLERAIHKHLDEYRIKGEWFADCPAVRATIKRLATEGPSAVGFSEERAAGATSPPSEIQVAITNLIKSKRPHGTKAWEMLTDRFGIGERAAKYRLSNRTSYTAEEFQALVKGEDGHDYLKTLMADANPKWWRPLKRALKSARFRKAVEAAQQPI